MFARIDVLEEHERRRTARRRPTRGSGMKRGRTSGQLHARELRPAAVLHDDREVLAEIRDERERMARDRTRAASAPDRSRARSSRCRYSRHGRRVVGGLEKADALGGERRAERRAPARGLLRSASRAARWRIATQLSAGRSAVGRRRLDARRAASLSSVATRIMKNSSRFVATIARNFTRSSSGCVGVLGLREHALVELEPAQLAVDVERRVGERDLRHLGHGGCRRDRGQRARGRVGSRQGRCGRRHRDGRGRGGGAGGARCPTGRGRGRRAVHS